MEAWAKPIIAQTQEVSGQYSRPGERAIVHYLKREDAKRIKKKMACYHCLTVFPAAPAIENLQAWIPLLHRWQPIKQPKDVKADLRAHRCPTCNSEITDEMLRLMDVGDDYNNDVYRYSDIDWERPA